MKTKNALKGLALGVGLLGLGVAPSSFAGCCGGGVLVAPPVVVANPGCCNYNYYYAPSSFGYVNYPYYYRNNYYRSRSYTGCQRVYLKRVYLRCNNCDGYGCGQRCFRYVRSC